MSASKDHPRRVAALIRVSTEKQEQKGESLKVQKQHATEDIEDRWGAKIEWYAGNEHATPGYERKIFDNFLATAAQQKFDAVWINEPFRWSRDNARCSEGLNTLRENGIRFFIRTAEQNLHDPSIDAFLQMVAVMGSLSAGLRKIAGFDSREARAKQGIPTCGKLPHARLYQKKAGKWSLDSDKHERIQEIAKRVLKGEAVRNLAPEYGMSIGNLHKVLMNQCGDTWSFTFKRPGVAPKTYPIKIPRLLPDSIIERLRTKIHANRLLFHNGEPRHKYLLKGYIFCGHCGYNLYGSPNRGDKTVYRHTRQERKRKCSCEHKSQLRAEVIEENVVWKLFEVQKNPRLLEAAMKAAVPSPTRVVELQDERKAIRRKIKACEKSIDRIVAAIGKGTIRETIAKRETERIESQQSRHEDCLREIDDRLNNIPGDEELKYVSAMVYANQDAATDYSKMTWDDKRALIENSFALPGPDGRSTGVFVTWDATDVRPNWRYEIRGLISVEMHAPYSLEMLEMKYDDSENSDYTKKRRIKQRNRGGDQISYR